MTVAGVERELMSERNTTHSRRAVLAGAGIAAVAGLSGCLDDLDGGELDATETTTATYATTDADRVALSTTNGGVTVRGARTDEIDLTVRKAAADGDRLDDVVTDVSLVGATLRITAETGGAGGSDTGSARADLELIVPRTLPVGRVRVPNGDAEFEGVGAVDGVYTSNGDVTVDGVDGPVRAEAANGSVKTTDVAGSVTAVTTTGDISLQDVTGPVDATTATGDVSVTDVDGVVDVVASTGDVDLASVDGRVDVDTSTGDIRVTSVGGDAVLSTTNGDITSSDVDGVVRRR
jgi:hypothetical protein